MTQQDPLQLVGTMLDGRYRVDAVVGEGGFGVVYRGLHGAFEKPVAIKVLKLPERATAEIRTTYETAFRAEGKILRQLSDEHSAFVRVSDMGFVTLPTGHTTLYLAMEWLDGEPLERDLERRRTAGLSGRPLAEIITCLTPIAEALAVAHAQEQRIAHRDIKPANIFLTRTNKGTGAKLLDFGIAKVMTDTGTAAWRAATQGAMPALTAQYAAPEQWHRGRYGATGPWTDVYALALVCVEMLTDRPALLGEGAMELMASTVDERDRPTPSSRGRRVPDEVEAVFRKALAIEPKNRYPNALAFWTALTESSAGRRDIVRQAASVPATFANLTQLMPPPRLVPIAPTIGAVGPVGPETPGWFAQNWPRLFVGLSIGIVLGIGGLMSFWVRGPSRVMVAPPHAVSADATPGLSENPPSGSAPTTLPTAEVAAPTPTATETATATATATGRWNVINTGVPKTPPVNPDIGGREFDRAAAMSALSRAAGAAKSCKKDDGPTGAGKVKVTFAPSGNVTSAFVEGPPFAGTAVGGCVAAAFRSAHVPPFDGGPISVSKSFIIN